MISSYAECLAELRANADKSYDDFNKRIVNCAYPTIGVRTPVVKKLAKCADMSACDAIIDEFIADKHKTYEGTLFVGCLAARNCGDCEKTAQRLKRVIPFFASWAHVDCVVPLLRQSSADYYRIDFRYLLDCDGEYERRFYIILLMDFFLTDECIDGVLETLKTQVTFGQYYVDMAAAWLLAEALVKQYEKTLPAIEQKIFPKFVHNKAIQKARESYRISAQTKAYLDTLKIK